MLVLCMLITSCFAERCEHQVRINAGRSRAAAAIPEPDCDLPDSDLEHSAEQLWVVGDNPSDVDDQLLLKNGLPLPTMKGAFAVDDALDHPWRQRIGDHLLFMPE